MVGCDVAGLGFTPNFSWMSCKPKHGELKKPGALKVKAQLPGKDVGLLAPFPLKKKKSVVG